MFEAILKMVAEKLKSKYNLNYTLKESPKSSSAYLKMYKGDLEPEDFYDNLITIRFSNHDEVGRGIFYEYQYQNSGDDLSNKQCSEYGLDEDGDIEQLDEEIYFDTYKEYKEYWSNLIFSDVMNRINGTWKYLSLTQNK